MTFPCFDISFFQGTKCQIDTDPEYGHWQIKNLYYYYLNTSIVIVYTILNNTVLINALIDTGQQNNLLSNMDTSVRRKDPFYYVKYFSTRRENYKITKLCLRLDYNIIYNPCLTRPISSKSSFLYCIIWTRQTKRFFTSEPLLTQT